MALRLDEFLYLNAHEKEAAEKLPIDSPERRSMLARKLAEIRANSRIPIEERLKTECQITITAVAAVTTTT